MIPGVGIEVNGAKRWIGAGLFQIQPSEIAKVALILYGAQLLATRPKMTRSIGDMGPFLLAVAVISVPGRAGAGPRDGDGRLLRRRGDAGRRRRPDARPRDPGAERSAS